MFQLWRRDYDDPCGAAHTVTVTQTVLQGAETSTLVDFGYITTASMTEELIATATGRPNIGLNAVYGTSQTSEIATTTTGPTPTTDSNARLSSTRETTISVTSTFGTTKTLSLISASTSGALPRASECPSKGGASRTAPAATIAGSVVGSMAGLALIGLLVSYCLKRKRKVKLTLKRKTETKENSEELEQIENVIRQRDQALEDLERTRSIVSPKSFDFGFVPSAAAAALRSPSRPLPLPLPLPKNKIVLTAPPPQWI